MSSRSTSSKGAVRLTAKKPHHIFRHYKKLSLGLLAVSGGILITTQSNGTTDASKSTMQVLSTPLQPTFYFDDLDNMLPDQQPDQQLVQQAFQQPGQQRIVRRPVDKTESYLAVQRKAHEPMAQSEMHNSARLKSVVHITTPRPVNHEPAIESTTRHSMTESVVQEISAVQVVTTPSTALETEVEWNNTQPELVLAMNVPAESAVIALQPHYVEQSQDTQAGRTTGVDSSFARDDTTPKTTAITPLVDDPSAMASPDNTAYTGGATTESVTIAAGDTLSKLLNDRGVKLDQMPQLLTDDVVRHHLSNLEIGQTFHIVRLASGEFHSLSAKVADQHISIQRSDGGFTTDSIDLPMEKERVVTSGTIEHSLYVAADRANLKQSTIMELSDIFQWELDFARDIRKGDYFSLIYDRLYRDGKYIGDGDILAAEFIRGGKHYQAIRYTDPDGKSGYYSPDGQSKRRTFLRHPVDVVRITSKFDPKRVHPVLHQIRAHKGVDYGSPIGTPIRATADGIVQFSGSKSAYGNTVVLSHGTDIRTLYAHMSRISDKISSGKRVKQGDVIGYVGATGRVTGAHLHYEFQKNGNHVDPLKVELPAAQPLKAEWRDSLRELSDDLLAQMRSVVPGSSEPVVTVAAKQQ